MLCRNKFLSHLETERYSTKTIDAYTRLLKHFERFCKGKGIKKAKGISEKIVTDYLQKIRKAITKDYYIKMIRLAKYFQYLEEEEIIFLSPLKDRPRIKYPRGSYPTLSEKEIEMMLAKINTDDPLCLKGKAIMELAFSSALRPRELYDLKISEIDFKKGLLFITQSKNQKDRIVPVGATAISWVKKYIQEVRHRYVKTKSHDYVFINHKTGERLTVWGIRWAIQETMRRSGLKAIKPYSIRSTAATALLLNGMNIGHISKMLGHSELRTTQIYLKVGALELEKELHHKHPRASFEKKYRGGKENEI